MLLSNYLVFFDSSVGATSNYGCEIWGFGKAKDNRNLKFCKMSLNVKTSTSKMGAYGELSRYSLCYNTNSYGKILV